MTERNQEAQRLAKKVVAGGIVQKAAERLVYQIVEVCAEHERENTEALRARVATLEAAIPLIGEEIRAELALIVQPLTTHPDKNRSMGALLALNFILGADLERYKDTPQ